MSAAVYDRVLIGGEWVTAAGGTYPVVNPATEEVVAEAPEASVEQAHAAAAAARAAFTQGDWPKLGPSERSALLREAAQRFRKEIPNLVELAIAETGAVRRVAEPQQVGAVAARLEKYATLALMPTQEALPPNPLPPTSGPGLASGLVVREPVGVVACINPFNFPMTNCAGKLGPALAWGNTCIVKPSPIDPLAVIELCRIVGNVFPPGVVNLVSGRSPEIGAALTESADVDMISFTGSTSVGQQIQAAGSRTMKRTLLELGGKSAQIVFADCDLEKAFRGAMQVWSFHSGQICIAGTRLLIEESIYDDFVQRLARGSRQLKIGDPREGDTVVGPLVSASQRERVERYIERGVAEGALLACGGRRPASQSRGYFVEPTLFTGVRNDMAIAREEIFGPVIVAIPFRDEAEAIAIANDSDFGLYGYVWTRDTARGLRVARSLRTGTVQINGAPPNGDAPFGGFKLSGVGRDGGAYALNAYTEMKYIGWTA